MAPSSIWNCFSGDRDYRLTTEQKRRSKMTSSVDPTRAITEEEPFQVNQAKQTNNLRASQFKDQYGNPIREPDLSNPTRNRWERPLETIRAFEDAIHKEHRRASSHGDRGTDRRSRHSSETINTMENQQSNHYDHYNRSQSGPPRNHHHQHHPDMHYGTPRDNGYGEHETGYGSPAPNPRSPVYGDRIPPRGYQNFNPPHGGPARSGYDRRQNSDSSYYRNGGEGSSRHMNYMTGGESYQSKPSSNSSGPGSDASQGSRGGVSVQPPPPPPPQPQPKPQPQILETLGLMGGQGSAPDELFSSSQQIYEPLSPGENWSPAPGNQDKWSVGVARKPLPPSPTRHAETNAATEKRKSWFKRKLSKG